MLKIRTTGDHRLAFRATILHQISGSFLVENVCGTDEHQIRKVKDETSYQPRDDLRQSPDPRNSSQFQAVMELRR